MGFSPRARRLVLWFALLAGSALPLLAWAEPLHLFFHPLIAFPEKAFDAQAPKNERQYMDQWFITEGEFNGLLGRLYERGYVLVDFYQAYDPVSLKPRALDLAKGKKALIISVDDLNYYGMMRRRGTNSYLQAGADGKLYCVGQDGEGRSRSADHGEVVNSLELFISQHPDFSYHGARGIIALTGYKGLFGWYMAEPSRDSYRAQLAGAKAVAQRLREMGWRFASHSWAHRQPWEQDDADFCREQGLWQDLMVPVVGPTQLYVLPFGASLAKYPARLDFLRSLGFKVLLSVDGYPPRPLGHGLSCFGRYQVDGKSLRPGQGGLGNFVDLRGLRDPAREGAMAKAARQP